MIFLWQDNLFLFNAHQEYIINMGVRISEVREGPLESGPCRLLVFERLTSFHGSIGEYS